MSNHHNTEGPLEFAASIARQTPDVMHDRLDEQAQNAVREAVNLHCQLASAARDEDHLHELIVRHVETQYQQFQGQLRQTPEGRRKFRALILLELDSHGRYLARHNPGDGRE